MSEHLLEVISTKGQMTLDNFNTAFNVLLKPEMSSTTQETDFGLLRIRVIRILDALGHCEFDYDNRVVYACSPSIISIPWSGLPKAVLTGARTPTTVKKLKAFVDRNKDSIFLSIIPQTIEGLSLPSVVYIESVNMDLLRQAAETAGLKDLLSPPASWILAHFSPNLDEIKQALKYEIREKPNWQSYTFSPTTLTFLSPRETRDSLSLDSYINPINQQRRHWIWNDGKAADIDRDWGRFSILTAQHRKVLLYDENRQRLAIPATVPLPRYLVRSATLCSGRAPWQVRLGKNDVEGLLAGTKLDIFEAVPSPIAKIIAQKLSQQLLPYQIEHTGSGKLT